MPTYYPATQAEIDAALAAFYSGAPIPNGFAVNLTWPEKVRRVDPDAPAPAWPSYLQPLVPGPGEIVVGGADGAPEPHLWGEKADVTEVPTIGELCAQTLVTGTISASASYPVFIAPFPCVVAYVALMNWGNDITASDTTFWTVALRRLRAGTAATIATKTTKVTGGEGVTLRKEWSFDAIPFDAANKVLQKGDGVDFQFTINSTPANWNNPILTIRYEPV